MRSLRALLLRLGGLFRKERRDAELSSEIDSHLQMHIEDNLRAGMNLEEARRQALTRLGGIEQTKENYRDRRGLPVLEVLLRDTRYALRMLRKNPGFAAVSILTLALGIGANSAIFQMLDALTMASLPVRNPQEIAEIKIADRQGARGSVEFWNAQASYPLWEEIRHRQQAFSGIFAWSPGQYNLSPSGEARWASGLEVSGNFFSALGIQPVLGRMFGDADDQPGCSTPGVVLSNAFWQREFAGSPTAIGKKLTLEDHLFEIIGVTPANFTGLEVGKNFDVAIPLCAESLGSAEDNRSNSSAEWWLVVIGRLKPGWTIQKASEHLAAISPGVFESSLRPDYPKVSIPQYLKFKLTAVPAGGGLSLLRENYASSLWMLLAITGVVLLIVCTNLANLMLARASARERELTVRTALGASRMRLVCQLLTEGVMLAGAGAALGVWVATILSQLLLQFLATESSPIFLPLHLDWRTIAFTSSVAAGACILFSLAPALRGTKVSPSAALKSSGRGATSGPARFTLRRLLVVSQIAFSLMLLVGALLFTRSFLNLTATDTGLNWRGVLISYLDLSRLNLPVERRLAFKSELVHTLEQIPGVESVAETSIVPLSESSRSNAVWMDDSDSTHQVECSFSDVTSGYFKTLGISMLAGRNFLPSDSPASPNVAMVNESFARQVLHGGNPVGLRFWREATPRNTEMRFEIVGVVKDSKYNKIRRALTPIVYLPQTQEPHPTSFAQVLIRSNLPSAATLAAVKSAVTRISPDITATYEVFNTMVRDSLVRDRLMAWLSSFFGLLAILLAAVGLYGVIAYVVAQRTNEVGIRMALGASGGEILRMFLGETAALLGIGCVAGGAMSLAAGRAATALLYGLKSYDPLTFALAATLLAGVAISASFIPAWRAARADPVVALRYE
jgi:putative ABC transport system permease protein